MYKEVDEEKEQSPNRFSRAKNTLTRPTKATHAKEKESVNKSENNSKIVEPKRRKSTHPQKVLETQVDQSEHNASLKSAMKHPKNLKPPNKKFMELPQERSTSLGRYNRYFSDPTFDPAERFKRAQQRIENLQKQVNSLERPHSVSKMRGSKKNNGKAAKKSPKSSMGKGDEAGWYRRAFTALLKTFLLFEDLNIQNETSSRNLNA